MGGQAKPDREGVLRRAWRDGGRVANDRWRFQVPALLLTACFAAVGALLPSDAAAGVRVGTAVLGSVGGLAVAGAATFITVLVAAPFRQRDEARSRLREHEGSDLEALAEELDAFVIAERATAPDSGFLMVTQTMGMSREDRSRVVHEHNERVAGARREVLVQYHDRFRARIMDVLREPRHRSLLELHADLARDPQHLRDVETLNCVLQHARRRADGSSPREPASVAESASALAAEIAADPDESRYQAAERDRAVALFDEAVAAGAGDGSGRRRVISPDSELRGLAELFDGLADDLSRTSPGKGD